MITAQQYNVGDWVTIINRQTGEAIETGTYNGHHCAEPDCYEVDVYPLPGISENGYSHTPERTTLRPATPEEIATHQALPAPEEEQGK